MFHHKVLILVLMSVLIDFLIVIANATLNSQCNLESVFSSKLVSVEENAENSRVILGGTDRPVLMGPISDDEPDGAFVAVFDFFMTYKGSQFMDNRYLEDVGFRNSGTVNITFTSRPLIDCQIAQVPTKYIIFCDVVDNELVAHSVAKWDQETDQRVWMAVGWTKWSEWSTCSVSCGKGIQQRLRYCTVEKCEGYNVEQRHCNLFGLMNSQIRIRVGEHDFSNVEEMLPHVERGVVSKIVHPKYNFYTYEYDLALVKLDKPLDFAPHIMPICLPASDDLLVGENATVTGWGRLSEGGLLPTVLQEVHVPILSNEDCKSMFLQAGRHEYIPDIFLCAGHETGGKDSCQGDSGGPLQVRGKDGRYFLAGIISWGIGCAEKYLPGVCTRISKFVPWILKNVT